MQLLPADYIVCGVILVMALVGMFRGVSGALAFTTATAVAGAAAVCCWKFSVQWFDTEVARGLATVVAALVVFGIARAVVKRIVRGLLAGPSDSLFGFLIGAGLGIGLLVVWAYSGIEIELSVLAQEVSKYVR